MNGWLKILLIEDNPGDADLIEEMLSGADVRFELKCVERLSDGIEQIKSDSFDVILLDLGLPDSRGLDTLMRLHESKPAAPVIVLTGLADETVGTQAVKAGAQDYIIKGQLDKNLLSRSIRYAIERTHLEGEREQYFRFFQTSADLMCFADPHGVFIKTNPAFSETLGYTETELVSKPFIEFVHPEDKPATLDEMASQLQKGFSMNFENRYICKDGSLRWLSWRAIYNKNDGITYATARDITDRKQAEERAAASQKLLQNIADNSASLIYACDLQGRFLLVNRSFEALFGVPYKTLIGKARDEIMPPDIAEAHRDNDLKVIDDLKTLVIEEENKEPDGRHTYLSVKFPLVDPRGRLYGVGAVSTDITERKRTEEFIKGILESVDEGFIVIDRDYRIISANRAFTEQTGMSLGDMIGKHCFEISHNCMSPCYVEGEDCAVRHVFDTGESHTFIHRQHGVNTTPCYVETKAYPLTRDKSGNVMKVIEILVDITEKKKGEERLKLLNECFLEFGTDPEENINRLVSLCGRLLGGACALYNRLDREMLCSLGQWNTPPDYNPVDSPEGHICYDVIRSESDDVTVIRNLPATRYAKSDPNVTRHKLLTYVGVPVTLGSAHVGSLCVVYQNDFAPGEDDKRLLWIIASAIGTEEKRRQAEESLKMLTHKVSLILDSTGEGIYGVDLAGKVTFMNPAAARMLGYESEKLIGKLSHETWHHHNPEGTVFPIQQCSLNNVLKEGTPCSGENVVFWKRDGTKLPVEYSSTPMFEAGKLVGAVVTFRDITGKLLEEQERKKLEDQLRHAQKMEAVGTLAGGIAHDFNNILNVIIGYGTMALDRHGDDQITKEQLNEVLAAADKAANLTKRLLAFSRKQVPDMKPVNVNQVIVGMEKMLCRIIGEDIAFVMELAGGKMFVMADAGQLEQVLMNLISNARDAMPKGGRLLISTALIEVDEAYIAVHGYGSVGTYVLISVADTGSGISLEMQKKIFEPFFTTKGVGEGTGLGLSIAYGIIKQHDGYIQVYSEEGKGTSFKILLPIIEEAEAKVRGAEAETALKGGTERILIAEDDASLRKLLTIALESFGYSIIAAENGEEAISKYLENKDSIRLVVLDMIMPKKNGKEAYEEIRKINPDVRALFASGYTMDLIHKRELFDLGMDFILKPVSPKELVRKVREMLDRR
jgi:PAS domain S-box-containing protein